SVFAGGRLVQCVDRFGQRRVLTGSRTLAAVGGRRHLSVLQTSLGTARRNHSVTGREYLSLADTVHVQLVDFDRAADVSTGPGDVLVDLLDAHLLERDPRAILGAGEVPA